MAGTQPWKANAKGIVRMTDRARQATGQVLTPGPRELRDWPSSQRHKPLPMRKTGEDHPDQGVDTFVNAIFGLARNITDLLSRSVGCEASRSLVSSDLLTSRQRRRKNNVLHAKNGLICVAADNGPAYEAGNWGWIHTTCLTWGIGQ